MSDDLASGRRCMLRTGRDPSGRPAFGTPCTLCPHLWCSCRPRMSRLHWSSRGRSPRCRIRTRRGQSLPLAVCMSCIHYLLPRHTGTARISSRCSERNPRCKTCTGQSLCSLLFPGTSCKQILAQSYKSEARSDFQQGPILRYTHCNDSWWFCQALLHRLCSPCCSHPLGIRWPHT